VFCHWGVLNLSDRACGFKLAHYPDSIPIAAFSEG
jgi:hypothetical protein